jgi:hypothetical protein
VCIERTGAVRENGLVALSLSRGRLYDGLILSTVGMGPAVSGPRLTGYRLVDPGVHRRLIRGRGHGAAPPARGALGSPGEAPTGSGKRRLGVKTQGRGGVSAVSAMNRGPAGGLCVKNSGIVHLHSMLWVFGGHW